MAAPSINLRDLAILVADSSSYFSLIVHRMLRGFGADKILECRSSIEALQVLNEQKIDILLCDAQLPPHGGLALTRAIRRKADSENRLIPILLMINNTRGTVIRQARDAGANMVMAKPVSPASLYDRLAWIALTPRQFVNAPTYFGPDRRFKVEPIPGGVGRRKDDQAPLAAEEMQSRAPTK